MVRLLEIQAVSTPFKQIFSIHGFIKGEKKNMKQEASLHVSMTRRRKEDYIAAFNFLLEFLPALLVTGFVSDFEMAVWLATESCFKKKRNHKGFNFHFGQAIIREKLYAYFRENRNLHKYWTQKN